MNYISYIDLNLKIKESVRFLTINTIYLIGLFLIYSFLSYMGHNRIMSGPYLTGEVLCLGGMGFLYYIQTAPFATNINNTALEVMFFDDHIVLKTSPFKMFLWVDKPSVELRFLLNEINIRKTSYPLKRIYNSEDKVYKITDREKEAYILGDFFDDDLVEKLIEIKGSAM
jgi:hypothetical protein